MKKFSKSLSALLIATLLISVLSVMSFAVTESGSARLNVTSDPYNFYNDFSEGKNSNAPTYGNTLQNDGTHIKGVKMDYKGGYFRIFNSGVAAASTANAIAAWAMTLWAKSAAGYKGSNLLDTSYAVLDFEFGTDRYFYTYDDNGTVKYATTKSLDTVGVDIIDSGLAYAPGSYLCFYLQAHELSKPTNYDRRKYDGYLWLVQDENGAWYASANNTYDSSDIKLSNEIDKADHISVVLESVTDAGAVMFHVYVNGEHLSSNTLPYKTTCDVLSFRGAGISIPGSLKATDSYSYFMDNIALNWYRSDVKLNESNVTTSFSPYDSAEKYGVDDLIADLNKGVYNPIYMCEDVLYTGDYYGPNGGIMLDGEFSSIPGMFDSLLAKLQNDSVVETEVDIPEFDIPEGVESFTLIYDKEKVNINFTQNVLDNYVFVPQGDGKTYEVRTIQESDKFSLGYALDGVLIKTAKTVLAKDPENNIGFMKLDIASAKLSGGVCTTWKFDVDGSYEYAPLINLYEEEDIRALTLNEVGLVNEEFNGLLVANASSEGVEVSEVALSDYAYFAGRVVDGVLYVLTDSKGGFEQYKDIATLEAESANWTADVKCYTVEEGAVAEFTWNAGEASELNGGASVMALWHGNAMNDSVSTLDFNNGIEIKSIVVNQNVINKK